MIVSSPDESDLGEGVRLQQQRLFWKIRCTRHDNNRTAQDCRITGRCPVGGPDLTRTGKTEVTGQGKSSDLRSTDHTTPVVSFALGKGRTSREKIGKAVAVGLRAFVKGNIPWL